MGTTPEVTRGSTAGSSNKKKIKKKNITDLLRRWEWEIMEHPPNSTDMCPCSAVILHRRHDGLKHSKKAGMLFRTTFIQDNPMWRITKFNSLLPCWMLIADGLRVSQQQKSEYLTKLCSTVCTTSWVTANLQRIGYTMKFPRCNNGTTMQLHRSSLTGTKGKLTLLTRYEPMRLQSLCQSERTTTRDTVQHKR